MVSPSNHSSKLSTHVIGVCLVGPSAFVLFLYRAKLITNDQVEVFSSHFPNDMRTCSREFNVLLLVDGQLEIIARQQQIKSP